MATIDPKLVELLKSYGETAASCWDCHGTWVAYHAAVERMAAKAGIQFDPPTMIESDPSKNTVVICVTAHITGKSDWSFGEASPANNKNSYPYAMAEKRARDRVALKLLGMAGLVYSEEEADDFKESKPTAVKSSAALKRGDAWNVTIKQLEEDMLDVESTVSLEALRLSYEAQAVKDGWTQNWKESLADKFDGYKQDIISKSLWAELDQIKTIGGLQSFWADNNATIKSLGPETLKEFTAAKNSMKDAFEALNSTLNAG